MEIITITTNYIFGVNCYLIKTETGFHLIDSGSKKKQKQLEKELVKAGCERGKLKLIILTHGHSDHVGNAAYLREKYDAKIAMHKGDSKMVREGDMFADTRAGTLVKVIISIMKLLGLSSFQKFIPDIYLEQNQDLSSYGLNALVIHTPGHSKGSISLLTDEKDLFCGDLIGNSKTPEKTTLIDDMGQLVESIEKIRELESLIVYPGHGNKFKMNELTV